MWPDELIGAKAVYLCLVRDPVQRLISQYEYEVLPVGNTQRCGLQHVASVPGGARCRHDVNRAGVSMRIISSEPAQADVC